MNDASKPFMKDLDDLQMGPYHTINVLNITRIGLHSVASAAGSDLSNPMRAAAEQLDEATARVEELLLADIEFNEAMNSLDVKRAQAASIRRNTAIARMRSLEP